MDRPNDRRILIVDDDSGIRLLLVTLLRRRGFRVHEASNGRVALEEMRAGNADLVVMDLMMPEVSGWDVLNERSADAFLQQIPVIIITANNKREVTEQVMGKDVLAVIGKPFDLDVLITAVTMGLEEPPVPAPLAA
jgi:CheY-like chemotaxis protein